MRRQILLRDGWRVRELDDPAGSPAELMAEAEHGSKGWLETTMPAQVHEVLLAHGLIGDPHVGRNAADSAWVGERDWLYTCRFLSPEAGAGPVALHFHGLDTLVTAYLNGREIGRYDNMFREWVAEVGNALAPTGEPNILLLHFRSPLKAIAEMQPPETHAGIVVLCKYLRKSFTDFGSYLGSRPHAVKVGVFDDILLDMREQVWIEDVCARCELVPGHQHARFIVQLETGGIEGWQASWSLVDPEGEPVASGETGPAGFPLTIEVPNPKLWWPYTHGTPHLYTFSVNLEHRGQVCDRRELRLGLREVKLQRADPDTGEPRFRFLVNGRPLFLQGAGMAPFEGMSNCPQPERMRRLLELAVGARMNLLRVWGDGALPEAAFYDECDRRGILVWHDFMFGYGMYADDDPTFLANVRAEATALVRRLRNHACILLWVGGNENHMGYDFGPGGYSPLGRWLFEGLLPEICAQEDPTRPYHPSSPFNNVPPNEGHPPNWPLEGDWHDYTTVTFSHKASVPAFASEIGRASAPSLSSMRRFMSENDLWPAGFDPAIRVPGQAAWPPMWQYRSVDGSWEKVGALEEYCDPSTPRDLIRVLGTAHGEYLQRRVERERRGVPDGSHARGRRCWGNMIWRLNDSWPIIYWSVIDYYGEPKIPYYFLRRAYAPVLLSFERTADDLWVWVVNDSTQPASGTLRVARMGFDGALRGELSTAVALAPGEAHRCLDTTPLGPISLRHEYLLAQMGDLRASHLLVGERYLMLPTAHLSVRWGPHGVELTTSAYARQVSLEMEEVTGAVFGDNYFDLFPGEKRTIAVVDRAEGRKLSVHCVNAETIQVELETEMR